MEADVSTGCCWCCRRNRVTPISSKLERNDSVFVEVRANRYVHVRHINPVPRDVEFEREMQMFLYGNSNHSIKRMLSASAKKVTEKMQTVLGNNSKNTGAAYEHPFSPETSFANHSPIHKIGTGNGQVVVEKNEGRASRVSESHENARLVDSKSRQSTTTYYNKRARTATSVNVNVRSPTRVTREGTERNSSPIPEGNLPTLFFIHGVGGSGDVWNAQIDHFAEQGYEIIVPDLIGHGFSSAPSDHRAYEFLEMMKDIFIVFDTYCKRQNVVIGHSYGFGAVLARKRRRRVNKLVMISGGAPTPLMPQPGLFSLPPCLLVCFKPVLKRGFRKSALYDSKQHKLAEQAFEIPVYVLKYTMAGQMWLEGDKEYHSWLTLPTLLIHGLYDKLISVDEELEMKETIQGCQLKLLDHSSHMVMMEKPADVSSLIENFLEELVRLDSAGSPRKQRGGTETGSTLSVKSVPGSASLVKNSIAGPF